eukprot:NODE_94_length_21525_cov_0.751003.p13 type:complete len:172 gc:universal NODE_94_length_21525_cov_0.751003:20840-20325(-)
MFYTISSMENSKDDLIVWNNKVYDVKDKFRCPILGMVMRKYLGKDCSHLFNRNGELKQHYNPYNGVLTEMIDGVPLPAYNLEEKWWTKIEPIGAISKSERYIKVLNTLSGQSEVKLIADEHTVKFILKEYDLSRLAVKYANRYLDLDLTAKENGIAFELELPAIYLVFVSE